MSYAEKPDEITKDEWMEKLNNLHIQRADMNRLIMNYLVTGKNSWQCLEALHMCQILDQFGVEYGTGWSGIKGCENFVIAVGFSWQRPAALVFS